MAEYQIQVLELGYDPSFPAGIAFDFWHMGDQSIKSSFSMTLLRSKDHCILYDCGMDMNSRFSTEKIQMEGDQNCHAPDAVLRSAGLAPEDVDSIVLSHCHWDHMSGLRYFPNAHFYIQRAETEQWERSMENPDFPLTHKSVVNPESLTLLREYVSAGKVTYLDGDTAELFPGIHVRTASGHSYAQNMLFVDNAGRHFAVIGDVSMRPESFQGTEAFPCFLPNLKFAVGPLADILTSYRQILDWVDGDVTRILMTHNSTVQEVWPTTESALGLQITTVHKT